MISALALMAAVLGAGLGAWAFWIEPRSIRITRVEVRSPRWPDDAPALTIAVLGDLHPAHPHAGLERLQRGVAMVNAERPDLVLLLGDYVATHRLKIAGVPPEATADTLAGLQARFGVFAVLGNHDWLLDGPRVRRVLEGAGIPVLVNAARRVGSGRHAFWLAGVDDAFCGRDDLEQAMAQVEDDAPVLLMSHSPDPFPAVPERVALTLAAHTHAGQVSLPLLGPLRVPSRYGDRYAYGLVEERGRLMFVTSGLGHSVMPVRFRAPPEIAVIRLGPAVR